MTTIFLIERDAALRDAFAAFAESHHFRVEAYEDLEAFVKAGAPGGTDIVVFDAPSPEQVQRLLVWLNARPPAPRLMVVSGLPTEALRRTINNAKGAIGVRKPLDPILLLETILDGLPGRLPAMN